MMDEASLSGGCLCGAIRYMTSGRPFAEHMVTPTYHIYTESQVAWLNIDDDYPRYARGPEKS